MKGLTRTLLTSLVILLLLAALFSGWKIYSIQRGYHDAADRYDSLSGAVFSALTGGGEETNVPAQNGAAQNSVAQEGAAQDGVIVIGTDEPQAFSPISIDFDLLSQRSDDVIGWLYLPDTAINYPVVQGYDNDYYLDHFIDGTPNVGGSLFADYACPDDFSGQNTIIYGHNMRDGSMFALVDDYSDQAFYDAHPVMYLNAPQQNYRVDFFAGFTTDPESFVYTAAFATEGDFIAYLNTVKQYSDFSSPVEVGGTDRIITLSTCTYSAEDVRFVLFGKLTEIG